MLSKEELRAGFPNNNEWERLLISPLDGKIGISPALQWRYNFGRIFRNIQSQNPEDE